MTTGRINQVSFFLCYCCISLLCLRLLHFCSPGYCLPLSPHPLLDANSWFAMQLRLPPLLHHSPTIAAQLVPLHRPQLFNCVEQLLAKKLVQLRQAVARGGGRSGQVHKATNHSSPRTAIPGFLGCSRSARSVARRRPWARR